MEQLKELSIPYILYLIPLGILGMLLIIFTYALLRAYIRCSVNEEEEKTMEILNSLAQNTNTED